MVSGEAVPVEHDSSTSNNNNNTNVTSSTSDTSSSTGNPHSALPVITTAEPITIFHYEVMSVGDVQVRCYTLSLSLFPRRLFRTDKDCSMVGFVAWLTFICLDAR